MPDVKHRGNGEVIGQGVELEKVIAGELGKVSEDRAGGISDFLKVSGNLAKAAGALTRRLTVDIAGTAFNTGKDVLDGARQGKSSSDIAAVVMNDWIDGARKVLGFDEELQRMGQELKAAARPMAGYVPAPVRGAVQQVSDLAPVRAMTDLTGMTVTDVRRNLRQQGMELLKRSTALDDPEEHPAMAMILREISPDEARVIRFLGEKGPQAVIDVLAHNPMTRKKRELVHNFSIVGREAGCIRPSYAPIYLDNLARLGVAVIRDYRLRSQPNYDLLMCQPEVQNVQKPQGKLIRLKIVYKGVELSDFGKVLFQQCLETETSRLAVVPDIL